MTFAGGSQSGLALIPHCCFVGDRVEIEPKINHESRAYCRENLPQCKCGG